MISDILFPDSREPSVFALPYEEYYREGIRGVVFDIDNTLVRHGEPATWEVRELFSRIRRAGLTPFLLSNNERHRVESFAEMVSADFVFKAGKPGRLGYLRACRRMGLVPKRVIAVGDQIFTDILGANRCGMRSVLVSPIDPMEEIQIKLKRILEKPVMAAWERRRGT